MAAEALPTTRRVEIIDKNEFAAVALNADDKTFVVYVAALAELTTMPIYPFCQVQVAALTSEETRIPAEYSDFSNVFFLDFAAKLLEYTRINDHPINLLDNQQSSYGLIYNLGLVEPKMLKIYIKANLANGFICSSKSPAGATILFVKKKDGSLRLCVNY